MTGAKMIAPKITLVSSDITSSLLENPAFTGFSGFYSGETLSISHPTAVPCSVSRSQAI